MSGVAKLYGVHPRQPVVGTNLGAALEVAALYFPPEGIVADVFGCPVAVGA